MTEFILLQTTVPTAALAETLARQLVERRLAACAHISGPIVSHYWWEGKLECSQEWECRFKTRASLFDRAAAAIRDLHTYEVPEIIAWPLVAASDSYLAWLAAETLAPV